MGNLIDPVEKSIHESQRPVLPDWMRDPPPPRATLGQRLTAPAVRLRWVSRLRERWWAWRDRRRLSDRYPKTVQVIAFFLAWAASFGLVMVAYACYGMAVR